MPAVIDASSLPCLWSLVRTMVLSHIWLFSVVMPMALLHIYYLHLTQSWRYPKESSWPPFAPSSVHSHLLCFSKLSQPAFLLPRTSWAAKNTNAQTSATRTESAYFWTRPPPQGIHLEFIVWGAVLYFLSYVSKTRFWPCLYLFKNHSCLLLPPWGPHLGAWLHMPENTHSGTYWRMATAHFCSYRVSLPFLTTANCSVGHCLDKVFSPFFASETLISFLFASSCSVSGWASPLPEVPCALHYPIWG